MSRPHSSLLPALIFCVFFSFKSQALEIIPLYSNQNYTKLGGCCESAPNRSGAAGILRYHMEDYGTWDVYGMSDRKWNEIALLKPVYLFGQNPEFDPTLDGITKVRRIQKHSLIWSYGVGLYTHNTKTTRFDLAALVTGLTVLNHFEFQYAINDRFSLIAVGRVGVALSLDDQGFVTAPLFGFLWRL
jgi:hypothetical protein